MAGFFFSAFGLYCRFLQQIQPQIPFQLLFGLFKQQNQCAETPLAAGIQIDEIYLNRQRNPACYLIPECIQIRTEAVGQTKLTDKLGVECGKSGM